MSVAASRTCSKQSSTSSTLFSRSSRLTASSGSVGVPAPTAAATSGSTRAGSSSASRPTHVTPSGNRFALLRASSIAKRDLPIPPGPMTVTSRTLPSERSSIASSSSLVRPTNDDGGNGTETGAELASGGSRAASCSRIRRCSSRNTSPGSMPKATSSSVRATRYVSRLSAWRPERYRASMSVAHNRSRSGCSHVRARTSESTSPWRPSWSAASSRSSSAQRRSSSSSRLASVSGLVVRQASAVVCRHMLRASPSVVQATSHSRAAAAARPRAARRRNRSRSSSSASISRA